MAKLAIVLADHERTTLEQWAQGNGRMAERSGIVLLSADGLGAEPIAAQVGVAVPTVYKWRRRYREKGLTGLRDLPRPGQPRRLSNSEREDLVRRTTEHLAPDHGQWTIRGLASLQRVTEHQVREAWASAGLRPHALREVQLEEHHAELGARARPVGLYVGPPFCAFVLQRPTPRDEPREHVPEPESTTTGARLSSLRGRHASSSAPPEGPTSMDSLRTTFMAASSQRAEREARRRELREELIGFLREVSSRASSRAAQRLHVVLSVDGVGARTRRALAGRSAAEHAFHVVGTNEAWVLSVDRWLAERRAGEHADCVHALRVALTEHAREHSVGQGATFAWLSNRRRDVLSAPSLQQDEPHPR